MQEKLLLLASKLLQSLRYVFCSSLLAGILFKQTNKQEKNSSDSHTTGSSYIYKQLYHINITTAHFFLQCAHFIPVFFNLQFHYSSFSFTIQQLKKTAKR